MNEQEILKLGRELLDKYKLIDWKIEFHKRKNHLGNCFYRTKTIKVTSYYINRGEKSQIENTILHEIAHALIGPKSGHDIIWKSMCKVIGATPERLGKSLNLPYKYEVWCKTCNRKIGQKNKKTERFVHSKCGGELIFKNRETLTREILLRKDLTDLKMLSKIQEIKVRG